MVRVSVTVGMPQAIEKFSEARVSARRIDQFMQLNILSNKREKMENENEDYVIIMKDASFSWNDTPSLISVNLKIRSRNLVGVKGAFGSGKSTLLAAILSEINLVSGQLRLKVNSISYAPQLAWVFAGTIRANILLGKAMDEERYKNVIKACCLDIDLQNFSEIGDLLMIGDKGVNLTVTTTTTVTSGTITSNTCTSGWKGVTTLYHCSNCQNITTYTQYTYTYTAISNRTRIAFSFRHQWATTINSCKMSKSTNPLTNYFKKVSNAYNIDEVHEATVQPCSIEETDILRTKRFKPNESMNSTTLTTNNTTAASISRSATAESTMSLSSNERDPCHGPAKAKEYILLGPFQPQTQFPSVNGRRFRPEWYNIYSWLEYSLELDRAFCFSCRLRGEHKFDAGFTINGFNIWKNGTLRLNEHQATYSHKESFERWKTTVQNHNNNTDVLILLDQQNSKQATENRAYLKELIRTAHFLARQGVSFRGHRENVDSKNRGNFLEILELRSSDNELIRRKKEEINFTEYKIQNELILLMNKQVLNRIVQEIQKAKYFSVMIDETTDISKQEQVSLVIRYTDENFNIHERFMCFERTKEMTDEALFNLLLEWLKKLNLEVKNIVGQSYDGASAMRGEYKGVAARLKEVAPSAQLGNYFYTDGAVGAADYLSQIFSTPIGTTYTISYWLYNIGTGTRNSADVIISI
ncbi:unnamed protein product [Rotaria sp. Silwood2]|nr:unnamed protein product [Rotaria sp. Silwood2]